MNITQDNIYVGVDDHDIDLFEGQYIVPNGMAYNSYIILDEKIAVMDTVDKNYTEEWLKNLSDVLGDVQPDYLVVQHMEPDHSANVVNFLDVYPNATVVSSDKAFKMMKNFFGTMFEDRRLVVDNNDILKLGKHTLTFITAPMVHWPEVIMTYDDVDKVLFSADAFGKFGALDVVEDDWACEARRYYFGIVGKYGAQVQKLLRKISVLDIQTICPLHGPVLRENFGYYINLYDIWSAYEVESDGIVIAFTSVYGNTRAAIMILADRLKKKGCPEVSIIDLAREDIAEAVEDAFRFGKIVLATTTYNSDIFPFMREFINHLTERGFKNRVVGFVENGSWSPQAAGIMRNMLDGCENLTFVDTSVKIISTLSDENMVQIDELADELMKDYAAKKSENATVKQDMSALYKIGYGLYVVTSNDGIKDNGLIVNTVSQVTSSPSRIAVCINKLNYSHDTVMQTGIMNVNCLSVEAPFSIFESFGFRSGKNVDKFAGYEMIRSDNGLAILPQYINAFMSLKVEEYVDLGTHGMFICSVSEAQVISERETMTYSYYQENVKPKPNTEKKKGYVCTVCGYVYEGDELPDDFVCPTCKHPASDFEKIS